MSEHAIKRSGGKVTRFGPVDTRTLVERVVDSIVEAAARGLILPGDRVVEAEVARELNISRVPVREAFLHLESQGIVVNTPYRGMRLMDVSVERIEQTLKVRMALETLTAEEVRQKAEAAPAVLAPLEDLVEEMRHAAEAEDRYALARLDTDFHREMCLITGNDVLLKAWTPVSLQLTIIFGLSALQKECGAIVVEHEDILEALRSDDAEALAEIMRVHIFDQGKEVDHESFVARLRQGKRPAE